MSESNELPKDWELKKFVDICLPKEGLKRGPFGSAIKKEYFVPDGNKVYEQSNAIYDDAFRGKYFINDEKYEELKSFNVVPGDIIVSCSGTLGRITIIPTNAKKGVINQALLRIRISENTISKKYFIYFFRSTDFQRKILVQSQGTAITNMVGMKDFKEIEIPLPPLPTQQTIVSKIEELFSELDKGIEDLKTAQQQLKVYRQCVLKYAFEGKLTNENVKEGELPDGWKWKTIGDIFEVHIGSTPKRNIPEYWEGTINWVSSGEIAFCNITKTKEKISSLGLENTSCKVHPVGTVIIAMIGEGKTRGQAAILKIEASHNQNTAAIRVNNTSYVSELLYYYLFLKYQDNRKVGSGNNQKALNKERVKNIPIPLLSLNEQHQIVQEIESRLSIADKMEESIKVSLLKAEALRQSILKKAFSGELV